MRLELFYNPALLIERLAIEIQRRRRLNKLRGTVAFSLKLGHIDSLEFLEIIKTDYPKIIYDIGANIGTWTLLAKANFPQVTVHAFEPLIIHHDKFEQTLQNVPNVYLHKVALGSSYGSVNMQVTSFSDASSVLEIAEATKDCFGITTEREEKVNIFPLDAYILEYNLPLPDLIKLDIQGYELEALRGAINCLINAKYIICEVSFIEFYKGQALFHEIVEFLHQYNFYLYALAINTPIGRKLSQTDVLFSKN
ncbi:FkbM family methyltransferase [Fortiea sp. LEGE XX443]|uniref:FkbM family methyltransferase n=1 Tax=Fortiea sp. LEGE XX443 TaxID=1828611 RepID=UPI00187E1C26|nr:FkbM family methyltransferase [Fortiea sp. LEGE XX443]MBE9005331.1 FkbM family methyltransferase [Fortiea sp. LEGE XX443]